MTNQRPGDWQKLSLQAKLAHILGTDVDDFVGRLGELDDRLVEAVECAQGISQCLEHLAVRGARVEFGQHPRTGELDIAVRYDGRLLRLRDEERRDSAAASLVSLVRRALDSEAAE